jgi:hypothetical protein
MHYGVQFCWWAVSRSMNICDATTSMIRFDGIECYSLNP